MSEQNRRSRRSVAWFVLLLVLGLAVWGCGGGPGKGTATTVGHPPAPPVTAPPPGGSQTLVNTKPDSTDATPLEYVEAVEEGRPLVILFYVPAAVDDQRVLESVRALEPEFPEYTFLLYDFAAPEAYGDLSTLLRVDYPPALILVDDTGTIRSVWNGFVDEGTLKQEFVDLGARP